MIAWLTLKSIEKLRPNLKCPPLSAAFPCLQCGELARAVQQYEPWGNKKPRLNGCSRSAENSRWNYQKARFNGCSRCRKLRKILERCVAFSERSQLTGKIQCKDGQNGMFWTVSLFRDKVEGEEINRTSVDIVREGRAPNTKEGIGIRPNDHAIDKTLIASWINGCDKGHAGACHSFQDPWAQIQPAKDILLIDVEQHCLIPQFSVTGPLKYVALSYVWGDAKDQLRTEQSNVSILRQPNGFSEYMPRVPLTVQDSMALVSSLGLKYLWVDRFCIIQDGDNTAQLAAMASIYANAYFTIVAREGDAQSGLAGSRLERPRRKSFETFQLNPHCRMLLKSPTTFHKGKIPIYDERSWTFQEWILSRRILVFHHQTVSWTCFATKEQENGVHPSSDVNPRPIRKSILVPGLTIPYYLDQVEEYCQRKLTYQADKLRAFDAIIAVFGRSLRGRMLYGLPELFFSESLLWAPSNLGTTYFGRNDAPVPSWSWAAWTGSINTKLIREASECTRSSRTNNRGRHFCMVEMAMVSKADATSSSDQIQDRTYWARKESQETNVLQSDGVPVLKGPDDNTANLIRCPRFFIRFSTERIQGFLTAKSSSSKNTSSNFVEEWSQSAMNSYDYLGIRLLTEHYSHTRLLSWPCLFDHDNNVIGYLDTRPDMIEDQYVPRCGQNTRIDLISIGGLELEWNFLTPNGANYLHRECPKIPRHKYKPACAFNRSVCKLGPNWKWRFYNVLWVEWKGNVAYRKGIGKIWADCWEKLEREKTEVTLG